MKNPFLNTVLLSLFFLLASFGNGNTAQQSDPLYSKEKIEKYIREVFAGQADASVLKNPSSKRMVMITDFFNRVHIKEKPGYEEKKIPLLSSVKLRTTDNPNLKRDETFDPANFNALKYDFPMTSKDKKIYRVDHTDYLISINPKE